MFDKQIITGRLLAGTHLLKTLSGHSFSWSEEELTDQRFSHFKLRVAVNFTSLYKRICPSFDLPFGTVMAQLKLFHVVEKNCSMQDKFSS